jgi:hypothetical protein
MLTPVLGTASGRMSCEPRLSCLRLCLTCAVQVLDFPGARFAFVNELHVVPETTQTPIPCYRVLDELGQLIPGAKYAQVGTGAFLYRVWRQEL